MMVLAPPRQTFGALAFAVVFSTIAANALWYQPHRIVAPFFATRDLSRFNVLPGWHTLPGNSTAEETTFKIERADPSVVVEGETPPVGIAPGPDGSIETAALPGKPIAQPENIALAVAVQKALIRRGLYNGTADGVIGPRTSAAILFYQQSESLPETGEVSEELLKSLMSDGGGETVDPAAANAVGPATNAVDPVAAAIRNAGPVEKAPVVQAKSSGDDLAAIIKGAEPKVQTAHAASDAAAPDTEVVRKIQQGLIRLGYPEIRADGMAGKATKEAIRSFEKHYNLPPSGEPGVKVLQKMREIGAV